MPQDSRQPRLEPTEPSEAEEEVVAEAEADDAYDDGPELTPAEEAAVLESWMVVVRQRLKDLDEGRTVAVPWDDAANRWMFEEDA